MFDGVFASLIMLFVVIGILWLAFVTTRMVGVGMKVGHKNSKMKIVDRIVLSQNQSLLLVQIEDKVFFIGTAPNSITLLSELSEDTAKNIFDGIPDDKKELEQFSHILNKLRNRKR